MLVSKVGRSVKNLKYFDIFLVQKTQSSGRDQVSVSSEHLKCMYSSLPRKTCHRKMSFAFKLLTRIKKVEEHSFHNF